MTMPGYARELAHRLAREAEAVCRRYLSNGRREGRYWLVGDVKNTPGRSMFVRLKGPETGKGAAGKWTDAATGEHGDLLDVIRATCGLADFHDVADEARRFLNLPRPEPDLEPEPKHQPASAPAGSPESARRLFAMSQPITGHNRGSVSADTRHYCFARNRSLTFPSALLLSARSTLADRDLAGDDRSRHRSRRPDHRRPSHLGLQTRPDATRRRSTRRGARWAIFSATPFASTRRAM